MICIRNFEPRDEAPIKAMHAAQGFDYELPSLEDCNLIVRAVLDGESGHPEMAVLLRRTAEVYLLIDPSSGTRKERLGKMLAMQNEVNVAAAREGLTDVHCWVIPEIERGFGKLLMHLGWRRPRGQSYFREVTKNGQGPSASCK